MIPFVTRKRHLERRGAGLILAVAVLAVLALLGLGFARLMVVERDAGRIHVENTHARFLSHAGFEDAISRLGERQLERGYATWQDEWIYRGERGVALASSPVVSFHAGEVLGYPYSGTMAPTGKGSDYADGGLQYALRVVDLTSLVQARRIEPVNGNGRILDNLGRLEAAAGRFRVLGETLGQALAAREPEGGYPSFAAIAEALAAEHGASPALTADLALLADHVTTEGWTDPCTIRPEATGLAMVSGAADARAAHPVNLNTAPPAILAAVFAGVQATWTDPEGQVVVHTVSDAAAEWLAVRIQGEREGWKNDQKDSGKKDPFFYGFADLETFLTRAAREADSVLVPRDVAVLLAMLNPNDRLVRFNPDLRLRYLSDDPVRHAGHTTRAGRVEANRIHADKSTLTRWTTEGCFDTQGLYRIESLGRILTTTGEVVAQHEVEAVVRLARKHRWTTQADFEALLASGASRHVATHPESLPARGAAKGASAVAGGLRLGDPDALPPTVVLAGFRSGDGAALLPDGHAVPTDPWLGLDTGPVLGGTGLLAHDGYLSDPTRPHVQAFDATTGMPVEEGTLEFWTKFSERGLRQSGGLLWATNDLPERAEIALPGHDEGVDTVVHYEYDPVAHRGYLHVARTYFHFAGGIPASGQAFGLKWEINGRLKPDAVEILKEQGRRIIQPSIDEMTKWTAAEKERWREVFAQWYAERVISAFTGGKNEGPDTKIVGIGHAVIEDIEDLPVMCDRWTSDDLDEIYPLIFEGDVKAGSREWVASAYHTVVNETDKYQYSYNNFAVNPTDYGKYYMEVIVDPFDGTPKKRWEVLKAVYAKVLERGLELPHAASRVEIVKEVYREELAGGAWVPTASSWKAGEWHHVQFQWTDTTGYLEAYFDGLDEYETLDEFGPLNVWSSRMREVRDRVYFGAYVLDRASDDAGDPASPARDLYWHTLATSDRLIVRADAAAGSPTQDRFHAEPAVDPSAGFAGSYARFGLPLRAVFGSSLDRAEGVWIDWTEYEPTSDEGRPYVGVQVWRDVEGGWLRLFRPEHGKDAGETIGDAQRLAQRGKPADTVDVAILFDGTDEERENGADALDQTPFLDEISVTIATTPEIVSWSE